MPIYGHVWCISREFTRKRSSVVNAGSTIPWARNPCGIIGEEGAVIRAVWGLCASWPFMGSSLLQYSCPRRTDYGGESHISQAFSLGFLFLVYFSPSTLTNGTPEFGNWPLKLILYFVSHFIGKTCLEIKALRDKARALTITGITNKQFPSLFFLVIYLLPFKNCKCEKYCRYPSV